MREDEAGALAALRRARLLVLPGGSPSRLLAALQDTAVGELVATLLADGGVVSGSSAGAMVLCDWTVLPDRRGPQGTVVERGLGLVPDLLVRAALERRVEPRRVAAGGRPRPCRPGSASSGCPSSRACSSTGSG